MSRGVLNPVKGFDDETRVRTRDRVIVVQTSVAFFSHSCGGGAFARKTMVFKVAMLFVTVRISYGGFIVLDKGGRECDGFF